jgi:hypothetical protein
MLIIHIYVTNNYQASDLLEPHNNATNLSCGQGSSIKELHWLIAIQDQV